ncbi:hypothetical protein EU527_15285 [Candidatus Thorarchaeota archaeon]|nr:MAG: hypothetical protein EU527_15285 [Candidatus Thorarchaeota archaeon]
MRREVILLFLMFLLVVSASDQAAPPADMVTFEPMNFVLSQTEMPIYELLTPDVNETYVQSLASSLFGIHDTLPQETEGIYFVNWSNSYLEVDSTDGSIWFADYDRLWNISSGDELPNATESQTIAEAWLDENGLVPANAEFAGIGTTNATIYNIETHVMHSKILNYHFNYDFAIDDFPIAEECASIKVIIGDEGEVPGPAQSIVGFDWKWRDINPTPYTTAVLIEFDSILSTFGIPADSVVAYSLVYETGEEDSNNDLLYPVYDVTLIETNDDGIENEFNLKFDATEFQPFTGIIQPASGIVRQPGVPISFDCQVQFGTPPYQYQWHSLFDGVLSNSENFTTSTLSEAFKENTPVPHPIILTVIDSENQKSYDIVAVTIDSTAAMSIDPNIVIIALGSITLLAVFLIVVKKKGFLVVPFLFLLLSAFIFLPITSAYAQVDIKHEFRPSAPTGAFDDGIKEVGVEWVGNSYEDRPLWNSESDAGKFYHHMAITGGYSQEFNWGEWNAWESDFRATEHDGNDTEWIDAVDFVYYAGHGNPNSISFTTVNGLDTYANFNKLKLGDGDLETLAMTSCNVLEFYNFYGLNVFELWGPVLQGIHQVCGFATGAKNSDSMGLQFALHMMGQYPLPALTIIESWFRAGMEFQPPDKILAVFYGTNSTNPFQPQLDDPINDHMKGFGYQCSDPLPENMEWYVYITSNC